MKVLVTGVGSLLLGGVARQLAERGDEVVCFQRRESASTHQNITMFAGDIRDRGSVAEAAAGCEAIIHGAARVGVMGSWEDFHSTNVDGTANVLRAAEEHCIARLVYVSTPSVAHVGRSIEGDAATPATTGRKRAFYAESKALAEISALAANNESLGVVALRPHLVWGPGDTQLVGRIVERARQGRLVMVGSGTALVDSTYIDNAVIADSRQHPLRAGRRDRADPGERHGERRLQRVEPALLRQPAEQGRGGVLAVDPVFLRHRDGGDSRRGVSLVSDADADDPLAGVADRKAFLPLARRQELLPAGAGRLHR